MPWPGSNFIVYFSFHSMILLLLQFSSDDRRLASRSDDKTIKTWVTATGAYLNTLNGHSYWVTFEVFSSDGQHLASSSDDTTVKIWDTATDKGLHTLRGNAVSVNIMVF